MCITRFLRTDLVCTTSILIALLAVGVPGSEAPSAVRASDPNVPPGPGDGGSTSYLPAMDPAQSQVLQRAITAYVEGDFAAAARDLAQIQDQLKGSIRQEAELRHASAVLLSGQIQAGRTLLEAIRDLYAGTGAAGQADQMLQRTSILDGLGDDHRAMVLRAEHRLAVGDMEGAMQQYTSLAQGTDRPAIKEYAQDNLLLLDCTKLVVSGQLDQAIARTRDYLSSRTPADACRISLKLADLGSSRADGSTEEVFQKLDTLERLLASFPPAANGDSALEAEYHYTLGALDLHRLIYASPVGSGIDPQPLIDDADRHFRKALTAGENISCWKQAILASMVDVQLRQSHLKQAEATIERLQQEYPQSPLVAGAMLRCGIGHMNVGNARRASEWLARLLVDFPDSEEAIQARSLLKKMLTEFGIPGATKFDAGVAGPFEDEAGEATTVGKADGPNGNAGIAGPTENLDPKVEGMEGKHAATDHASSGTHGPFSLSDAIGVVAVLCVIAAIVIWRHSHRRKEVEVDHPN